MPKRVIDSRRSSASPHNLVHPDRRSKKAPAAKSKHLYQVVLSLVLLPVFAYVSFQFYQSHFVLPMLVCSKLESEPVLKPGSMNVSSNPDKFWGSYHSNAYFGLRTRSPMSPRFGMMWFEQPLQKMAPPKIRHWCSQNDELVRYGWVEHDSKSFGLQYIEEKAFTVETSFIKRGSSQTGGDWSTRISFTDHENANPGMLISVIVYFVLYPDDKSGWLKPNMVNHNLLEWFDSVVGETAELGQFKLSFLDPDPINVVARSHLALKLQNTLDLAHLKEIVMSNMRAHEVKSEHLNFLYVLAGGRDELPDANNPNFVALQLTFIKNTQLHIMFESVSLNGIRKNKLTGNIYEDALEERRKEFSQKFESTFELDKNRYAEVYQELGKYALSNMLGSISYFYGNAKVISKHNSHFVEYGPLSLFSGVPSRSFFPRGFLWDEGFHNLLIRHWDPELSFEILGSWLDLMNIEGWIPREVILGDEAESKVPSEFVVQNNENANPPMFFYVLNKLLSNQQFASANRAQFARAYPRLKLWYTWLNSSQAGPVPGSYRWRGRNATTETELNPKTLTSGLDDYPRASHPTDDEYHVDLFCWMSVATKFMSDLTVFLKLTENPYKEHEAFLYSPDLLKDLHWSQKLGRFADYGLHTRNVKLAQPPPKTHNPRTANQPLQMPMVRVVTNEPKNRLVSDTFGYVSMFPMMLKILQPDSPMLKVILDSLTKPELLWTRYGLRSLSTNSPLYQTRNTEHDPPYWRGAIWMNMNYLVLDALKHYAHTEGPYRNEAFEIYSKLRSNVISNVVKQFSQTGTLWEQYDDTTGKGKGCNPFTGWTSLVLIMMSEKFE